ncbi:MAG TPA: winged helix-turn-helix domain-containing protein [Microvirga sp.]|nr:winged helix-turn-helix domain-containing protein [Microvirga sp.]
MHEQQLTFGPFRLYPGQRRLLEGDRPVPLGSRALDILVVLAERAGQVVGKDELLALVWPGIHIEETNLRVHVSAVRKALGDGSQGGRFITNIPGRGYAFTAPVTRVLEAGEADAAPPPAGLLRTGELPSQLTSIVGREEIIRDLIEQTPQRRLTTLAGPGGIGKTTVAVAVANALQHRYADGVLFVELAPVTDAAFLPGRLAAVLGVALDPADPMAFLVSALRSKRILLVLDSCEHLIEAVADMATALLRQTHHVCLLTTSREPLRVEGEWVARIPPLAAPAERAPLTAAEARSFPAVRLFVDRAADSLGGYVLSDADAPLVCEICRRLDGIALAIELAAGRVDTISISDLAAQLDDRLRILTRGRRTALPRHQTLRAALDWSYERLSPTEQALFRRLSIFRAGFTFDAASAVCADAALPAAAIPEVLVDLVAKSLVSAEFGIGGRSYRLLDTMRAYAGERQAAENDAPELARRHATHVCALFEAAATEWEERPSPGWLSRHLRFLEDLRAALDWAFGREGDPVLGVALAIAAVPLWAQLSLADEFLF